LIFALVAFVHYRALIISEYRKGHFAEICRCVFLTKYRDVCVHELLMDVYKRRQSIIVRHFPQIFLNLINWINTRDDIAMNLGENVN